MSTGERILGFCVFAIVIGLFIYMTINLIRYINNYDDEEE